MWLEVLWQNTAVEVLPVVDLFQETDFFFFVGDATRVCFEKISYINFKYFFPENETAVPKSQVRMA